ncbi:MAG: hypothetical protein AB8G18_06530, partial [Gammaproteobacteria bacterium]
MSTIGRLLCVAALLGTTISSLAATHRLDFAGQNVNGGYNGYFLCDFNLAVDENPSPGQGQYGK